MKNTLIAAVVVVVLVLVGVYAFNTSYNAPTSQPYTPSGSTLPENTPPAGGAPTGSTTSGPVTVAYTSQGFSPSTVTVKKGQRVTFVNQTAERMWIASDEHPTHTEYDGTSRTQHCAAGYTGAPAFDQCSSGSSYTFTFTKTGTWEYHNHVSPQDTGTVVVTQ